MANPDIANKNRRRAASWPVFKLGITMEDLCRFLMAVHIHDTGSNWIFIGRLDYSPSPRHNSDPRLDIERRGARLSLGSEGHG
jgi:hypothetical protein